MLRRLFRPEFVACLFALLILTTCTTARADEDIVHFGNSIHVSKDTTAGDVVCFFCSVHIDGKVNGDTVVFFGDVDLEGSSKHDVVNFFGSVHAGNNSSIGEDLVNFFGSVRLGENVSVGSNLVVMFGGLQAAQSAPSTRFPRPLHRLRTKRMGTGKRRSPRSSNSAETGGRSFEIRN